ncbi:DUF3413 domain-containing protein [Oceanospirillum sediminis]|uniref:DUF3413 domain-containing protein n=1 Tax=Oceanospirillum sediminis TaxID=2760088 RepID=A0A839IK59_9GAMM|nr:DUF3413 domain-containing protein [Oceanospirillum sediminis]MBB1485565.1 DUF3413 domain-containing protein [Oceanospirillum sediminis]
MFKKNTTYFFQALLTLSWTESRHYNRRDWLRFTGWLTILSALTIYLIASSYLSYIHVSQPHSLLYLASAYIGHFALFAVLAALPLSIITIILPFRVLILPLAAITLLSGLAMLVIDTRIYAQYRFHLSGFIWDMLTGPGAGEIIQLSWLTLLTIAGVVAGLMLLVPGILSAAAWCTARPSTRNKIPHLLSFWLICLLSSQAMHVWYEAHYDTEVTGITRHFPSYYPATGKRALVKRGWINPDKIRAEAPVMVHTGSQSLNYPLNPLQCTPKDKPENILIIAIDAMRADILTQEITPNLYQLTQQENSQYFTNHFSGGNVTKGGIFTLFFGIPATYWDGFAAAQQGALWIREHQRQNYQVGLFSSSTLLSPAFDRTVFASVPDLRFKSTGETPSERDQDAIKDFEQFIEARSDNQPFFSFLFLDAVHGYDVPTGYEKFQPQWQRVDHVKLNNDFNPDPYFNRYKNSAYYLDNQIGALLDRLKSKGVLDNTIVMITSDHGEEFNDLGQNFWGHGSNFSDHQTRTPLIILWPGKKAQQIDYRTSHYDIAPTMMTEVLGCSNPMADYSTGTSLFQASARRDWLIVNSYFNYGIVGRDRIIATYPTGGYEIMDKNSQPVTGETMPAKVGIEVLSQVSRFYH